MFQHLLRAFFFINDVMCPALWRHLSSLSHQFSIFEDVGGGGGGGVDSPASLRRIVEAGLCTSFIVYLWSKPADQWCVCCNRCIIARFALLITDNIKDLALKINDPQQNHSEIHCCWDKEDRLPMQKLSRSIQRVRLLNDHDRHS